MTLLDAENAQEHQMILARNCRQHLARLMTLRYGPHPEIDNLGHAAAEGTGYRLQVYKGTGCREPGTGYR